MLNKAASSDFVLSSRRRRARARPQRRARGRAGRQALPDWAWGLLLGLLAIFAVGGVFLVVRGGLSLGGGGFCDKPLAPLETSDISAKGFLQEDSGLARVIELINGGAKADAEAAFYGPVHNFTHNADPPIREKDVELAKQLCQAVLKIEDDLVFGATSLEIGLDAQRIREFLREGAKALGYPPP